MGKCVGRPYSDLAKVCFCHDIFTAAIVTGLACCCSHHHQSCCFVIRAEIEMNSMQSNDTYFWMAHFHNKLAVPHTL
jgi:hypothetical protein